MKRQRSLPYVRTMFASCMLFQTLYASCVALWLAFPELSGHLLLTDAFPQFRLLDLPSFIYGLVLSGIYGWLVAAIFVFFYNLWPSLLWLAEGGKAVSRGMS